MRGREGGREGGRDRERDGGTDGQREGGREGGGREEEAGGGREGYLEQDMRDVHEYGMSRRVRSQGMRAMHTWPGAWHG